MVHFTVYTKENCRQCDATKRWLRNKRLNYSEVDYADYIDMLMARGVKSMPFVTTSNGDEWTGYRPDLLQKVYEEGMDDDS